MNPQRFMLSRKRRSLSTPLALALLLACTQIQAQANSDSAKINSVKAVKPKTARGILEGTVTDIKTGKAVPYHLGAVVEIRRTDMGAVTDSAGFYRIINIPPGKYTVQAQALGYIKDTKKNVKVRPDSTTVIDFKIRQYPNIDTIFRWDLGPRPARGGNRH